MKKRLASKIGAAILAASMMTAMAVPAMAATNYTAVTGTSTSFKKYLVMEAAGTVPEVTFSYTIAPGTAQAAGNGTMAVLAGIVTRDTTDNTVITAPTVSSTTFAESDTDNAVTAVASGDIDVGRTAADRHTGDTSATGVAFDTDVGEKYVKKTATVDFSSIDFPEPGIYRYIITETANSTDEGRGIKHDTDVERVLDVYVVDNNGSLQVSGYVMHKNDSTVATGTDLGSGDVGTAGTALADKTDGFTNEVKSVNLTVSKDVSGNQASRDKVFALTTAFTGLQPSSTYAVSLADDGNNSTADGNAQATSQSNSATIPGNAGQTNVTSITADATGAASATFYLSHGESVVVQSLPLNATYQVSENAEDYKPSYVIDSDSAVDSNAMASASNFSGTDHAVAFTNTRNGVIPTGVMMAVAPFAVATLIGGAGVATMTMKKRKKEEDE